MSSHELVATPAQIRAVWHLTVSSLKDFRASDDILDVHLDRCLSGKLPFAGSDRFVRKVVESCALYPSFLTIVTTVFADTIYPATTPSDIPHLKVLTALLLFHGHDLLQSRPFFKCLLETLSARNSSVLSLSLLRVLSHGLLGQPVPVRRSGASGDAVAAVVTPLLTSELAKVYDPIWVDAIFSKAAATAPSVLDIVNAATAPTELPAPAASAASPRGTELPAPAASAASPRGKGSAASPSRSSQSPPRQRNTFPPAVSTRTRRLAALAAEQPNDTAAAVPRSQRQKRRGKSSFSPLVPPSRSVSPSDDAAPSPSLPGGYLDVHDSPVPSGDGDSDGADASTPLSAGAGADVSTPKSVRPTSTKASQLMDPSVAVGDATNAKLNSLLHDEAQDASPLLPTQVRAAPKGVTSRALSAPSFPPPANIPTTRAALLRQAALLNARDAASATDVERLLRERTSGRALLYKLRESEIESSLEKAARVAQQREQIKKSIIAAKHARITLENEHRTIAQNVAQESQSILQAKKAAKQKEIDDARELCAALAKQLAEGLRDAKEASKTEKEETAAVVRQEKASAFADLVEIRMLDRLQNEENIARRREEHQLVMRSIQEKKESLFCANMDVSNSDSGLGLLSGMSIGQMRELVREAAEKEAAEVEANRQKFAAARSSEQAKIAAVQQRIADAQQLHASMRAEQQSRLAELLRNAHQTVLERSDVRAQQCDAMLTARRHEKRVRTQKIQNWRRDTAVALTMMASGQAAVVKRMNEDVFLASKRHDRETQAAVYSSSKANRALTAKAARQSKKNQAIEWKKARQIALQSDDHFRTLKEEAALEAARDEEKVRTAYARARAQRERSRKLRDSSPREPPRTPQATAATPPTRTPAIDSDASDGEMVPVVAFA